MHVVGLTKEELKIIRNYLFKNGYDYLNKEIKKYSNLTNSVAHQYSSQLEDCLKQVKKLEFKFINEVMLPSEGKE